MKEVLSQISEMKSGEELISALTELSQYDVNIGNKNINERLMALNSIYNIFLPNQMSVEIYSKLYLALIRSLGKKFGTTATIQRNNNHKYIVNATGSGIIGGSDSFTIIGKSGIGKSTAVNKAVSLISQNGIIEIDRPYTKIIPCLTVQCPFDSSVKGLLLEILRNVDEVIDSDYYQKATKSRITTDMIIGMVSQVALNHIGLLIVDEIQNVVNSKNGKILVGMLTQLINNSGISICMVGTPECVPFFEGGMQLARRSLGLYYDKLEYNQYFFDFCKTIFSYQYTKYKSEISDGTINWLYEHSGGIISIVISLIHDAQEIAILNGSERLDIENLTLAYKSRLTLLHGFIAPSVTHKSQTSVIVKSNDNNYTESKIKKIDKPLTNIISDIKENGLNALAELQKYISVEVIKI